jgi:hypothetical protein
MHSLAAEAAQLRTGAPESPGAVPAPLSVAAELRVALYVAVALIIAGVGLLLQRHLDQIGPLALVLGLGAVALAAYVPAIRARQAPRELSAVADYLLLLGALLLSADLGYAESLWHLLGERWSWHLLLLAVLHGLTAYLFGSRLVLGVALVSFAAWFGVQSGPQHLGELLDTQASPQLGARALVCAALILAWGMLGRRWQAGRFTPLFEHFATNLAFLAALGWCLQPHTRWLGLAVTLVLGGFALRRARRTGAESFAVYAVGYGALALILVIVGSSDFSALTPFLLLVVALLAAGLLRYVHARLKRSRA